jgi:RHS repeat-associated protein
MTYTADGEKLTKAAGATVKNYVSGIEYTGANLEAIYHGEGRLTPNGGNFFYEYTLKDHLGNARAGFRANGAAVTFLEETHYYPFGMQLEGLSTTAVTQNAYKYNGKEWNNDFGLGLYDYGARWYDASVGRWWSVDLKSSQFTNLTPYNYVANAPLILIDPYGLESKFYADGSMYLEGADAQNYFRGIQQRQQRQQAKDIPKDGMAIIIAFPNANPDIPTNQKFARWVEKTFGDADGKMKVGHAGIVVIDAEGSTKYFDFGRYTRRDIRKRRGIDEGAVRSSKNYSGLKIPN